MNIANLIMIFCFVVAAGLAVFLGIRMLKDKKNPLGSIKIDRKRNARNQLYWLYRIFMAVPFLRKYFERFRTRIETLYPADPVEVNRKATATMAKTSILALICMVVLAFMARTDMFYMLVSILTVYIIYSNSLSRAIDSMEIHLLKVFADFLTTVRSEYRTCGHVDDAIYATLDDLPHEMAVHANRVYEIVSSVRASEEVEKYTDIAPNRFLEMFAAICATISEYGDKTLENGESLFLSNLNFLKQEVYVEVTKREKNNFLFSGLIFLCVMPVFGMKLIARWASSVADLSGFYDGTKGMIMVILTFASTFVCYELISNMRDGRTDDIKEHIFLEKLAKQPIIRKWLTKAVEANYSKAIRIEDDLKMVGDRITKQAYLLKRLLYSVVLGGTMIVIVFAAHFGRKNEILKDFSSSYEDTTVPDETFREDLRTLSKQYMAESKMMRSMTQEEKSQLSKRIQDEQGMNEVLANEVAQEISDRNDKYAKSYFKYWYILLIAGAFAAGYFAPIGLLKYKLSIMKMSMEDEVAQYQTLALILMNVDGMTLDVILEWMERFAFCFKESISECIINLQTSEEKALTHMKNSESFPPFRRFCDNLLAIDEVGVASAFDEIKTEQENYKQQRALNNEIMMTKKSNISKDISFIPLGICIGGYLLYPFIDYAFSMMDSFKNALSY